MKCALALAATAAGCAGEGSDGLDVLAAGDRVVVSQGFDSGRRGFALAATADGELAIVVVEEACAGDGCDGMPNDRIATARYDADLSEVSAATTLAEPSLDSRLFLTACGRGDGSVGAAWSSLRRLVEGVNLDTADVELGGEGRAPVTANPDRVGSQTKAHVACLGDGGLAVTWESRCGAVRRTGNVFVHFRPEECDAEPEDGVYLRLFDAGGAPKGAASAVVLAADGVADEAGVAPLEDGGFLLVAGGLVQVRDEDGMVADEAIFSDGPLEDPLVSCTPGALCAAVWGAEGVRARVIDAESPATARDVTIARVEPEDVPGADAAFTLPLEPGFACDGDGVCLVTWRSVREISGGDFTVTEELGIFGRALDLRTGELGPVAQLVASDELEAGAAGPALVAVTAGTFIAARSGGDSIALQRLEVR